MMSALKHYSRNGPAQGLSTGLTGTLELIRIRCRWQSMTAAAAAASSAPVSPTAEQLMQRRELHAAQSAAQARRLFACVYSISQWTVRATSSCK